MSRQPQRKIISKLKIASASLIIIYIRIKYKNSLPTMAAAMFTASRKAAHAVIKTTGTRSLSSGADVLAGSG